jgi:hypothetical protein
MKKLFNIILLAIFAINTQAQTDKQKKALDETMETINEMDQMLAKEFTHFTSALDAVNGATFSMGECIVLGAYADEGFKKDSKKMQEEIDKMFNNSTWSFEKWDENKQSLVRVKTKDGQALSSPYTGFPGSATIKIGMLVDGLDIDGYFYQNKKDKTKYIMVFASFQRGVYVELTKKEGKLASTAVQSNATDAAVDTKAKDGAKQKTTPVKETVKTNEIKQAVEVVPNQAAQPAKKIVKENLESIKPVVEKSKKIGKLLKKG